MGEGCARVAPAAFNVFGVEKNSSFLNVIVASTGNASPAEFSKDKFGNRNVKLTTQLCVKPN